jgi:hypothetical protein
MRGCRAKEGTCACVLVCVGKCGAVAVVGTTVGCVCPHSCRYTRQAAERPATVGLSKKSHRIMSPQSSNNQHAVLTCETQALA